MSAGVSTDDHVLSWRASNDLLSSRLAIFFMLWLFSVTVVAKIITELICFDPEVRICNTH